MQFKVFVNALRKAQQEDGASRDHSEEKMFTYTIEAEDSEQAKARAKSTFELEQAMKDWQVEAILTMQL